MSYNPADNPNKVMQSMLKHYNALSKQLDLYTSTHNFGDNPEKQIHKAELVEKFANAIAPIADVIIKNAPTPK